MKTFAAIAMAVALSAWSARSLAQESAAPPAPAPPRAESQAPPAEAAAPPAQARPPASDEVFIPTEELSADEAVTFPVDI